MRVKKNSTSFWLLTQFLNFEVAQKGELSARKKKQAKLIFAVCCCFAFAAAGWTAVAQSTLFVDWLIGSDVVYTCYTHSQYRPPALIKRLDGKRKPFQRSFQIKAQNKRAELVKSKLEHRTSLFM